MKDRHRNRPAHNRIELTGKRFGKLIVLRDTGLRKSRRPIYECICDCGNITNILGKYLIIGDTKSCGCIAKAFSHNRDCVGEITLSFWTPIIKQANKRGIPFEIDRSFAWDLYCQQNRKCALTGIDISFSSNIRDQRGKQTCSLDRINNDLGYIEGNVQWVHKRINIMKNVYSQDEFIQWCGFVQQWMKDNPDMARKSVGHGRDVVHTPTL